MKITIAVALIAAGAAAPALAASPFDGTWKTDLKASTMSQKPHMIAVKDGIYTCDCHPPLKVKADGQFHKVTGQPYFDEVSVKVVSPREIMSIVRKGGKQMGTSTETLSADGNTKTDNFTDTSAANGVPVKGTNTAKRAAPAPAGALPISGGWIDNSGGAVSEAGLTQTFLVKGKTVMNTTPTGISYEAPLDGKPVPVKGDPGGAMASVKMTGPRTLTELDTIDGKPRVAFTYTVRPDGKTMDITIEGKLSGRVTKLVARKQ